MLFDRMEEQMTVWRSRGETSDGHAAYDAVVYAAMTERHREKADDVRRAPAREMLTGFLLTLQGDSGKSARIFLEPGRDCIGIGDLRGYASPQDAQKDGKAVFCLEDFAQPRSFSGGTICAWCHFRAARMAEV